MRAVNHRLLVPISAAVDCVGLASAIPAAARPSSTDTSSMSSSSQSGAAHPAQDRVNDALGLVRQNEGKSRFGGRAAQCEGGVHHSALLGKKASSSVVRVVAAYCWSITMVNGLRRLSTA